MPAKSRAELIRGYFAAYQADKRDAVAAVLSDDFTFTSPYDDAIDSATFFERCWPKSPVFRAMAIELICEDEDAAFVLYRCETPSCTGSGATSSARSKSISAPATATASSFRKNPVDQQRTAS